MLRNWFMALGVACLCTLSLASSAMAIGRDGDCTGWSAFYPNTLNELGTKCVCATATLYLVTDTGDVAIETQEDCQQMDGTSQPFGIGGTWTATLETGTYKVVVDVRAFLNCGSTIETNNSPDPRDPNPTFLCEGPPPPPPSDDCITKTQGYWKNHPEAWPVEELAIGNSAHVYSKDCLISVMKTPVAGDARISLIHQLIAAKLNFLMHGDDCDDADAGDCASDGDAYLLPSMPASGTCGTPFFKGAAPKKAAKDLAVSIAGCLEAYNSSNDTD